MKSYYQQEKIFVSSVSADPEVRLKEVQEKAFRVEKGVEEKFD